MTPVIKGSLMKLSLCALLLCAAAAWGDDKPFPVISKVDATDIAGRPVQLDAEGKLLPWPMPDDIGYSYSSHFLTQWTILWDQYNRQRPHPFQPQRRHQQIHLHAFGFGGLHLLHQAGHLRAAPAIEDAHAARPQIGRAHV